RPPAIACDIGHERDERPELAALHGRGGARGRALRLLDRNPDRARGVSLGDVHLKLPFATSAERGRSGRDNPPPSAGVAIAPPPQAPRSGCDLFPRAAWAIEPPLFLELSHARSARRMTTDETRPAPGLSHHQGGDDRRH